MIRFSLRCAAEHDFQGWFRNNADFDRQRDGGLIACPTCGSDRVEKSLMAPAVAGSRQEPEKPDLSARPERAEAMEKLRAFVRHVKANADDVGRDFPEEARKIHFGEAPVRGIYGEAKPEEARALVEEGIDVLPLPGLPQEKN